MSSKILSWVVNQCGFILFFTLEIWKFIYSTASYILKIFSRWQYFRLCPNCYQLCYFECNTLYIIRFLSSALKCMSTILYITYPLNSEIPKKIRITKNYNMITDAYLIFAVDVCIYENTEWVQKSYFVVFGVFFSSI